MSTHKLTLQDNWIQRRGPILAKFTTSQKLTLSAGSNKNERGKRAKAILHILIFSLPFVHYINLYMEFAF